MHRAAPRRTLTSTVTSTRRPTFWPKGRGSRIQDIIQQKAQGLQGVSLAAVPHRPTLQWSQLRRETLEGRSLLWREARRASWRGSATHNPFSSSHPNLLCYPCLQRLRSKRLRLWATRKKHQGRRPGGSKNKISAKVTCATPNMEHPVVHPCSQGDHAHKHRSLVIQ